LLRILLIDDDVHVLACLQAMIPWSDLGYEISGTAGNGSDALRLIQEDMPDVVITDLKMPVMDGLEFCRNLQALRDDIPILFLSAYEDFETARLAMKYNVTDYILKPINPQKIQLLCSILQELGSSYQQQVFFTRIRDSQSRQQEIAERLHTCDTAWFSGFFVHFTDCLSCRFQLIREACVSMIQILYRTEINGQKARKIAELQQHATKMEMVSFVAEQYDDFLKNAAAGSIDYYDGIFQQIRAFIQENFTSPLFDSSSIVARFHFSQDYLNRIFASHAGETLNAHINRLRMEHALALLQDLDLSIKNVAESSGYSNQNYFARIFKKQTGITPSEYQMELRLSSNAESGLRELA
jgi:two-component system, response regulator YesN